MAGGAGARVQIWRARGGAHVEHAVHAHDAVGELLAGGAADECGASNLRRGGEGRAGAHVEHVVHCRDAGGVEAQWLVERPRALPQAGHTRCGASCAPGCDGGRPRCTQRVHRGGLDCRLGAGHGRSAQ